MKIIISNEQDLRDLKESVEIEFKSAQGANGNGELPKDLWKSYSAMANTQGGEIILGVEESSKGIFEIIGIANPDKVITDFWNTVNSKEKVSSNLLENSDVEVIDVDGKSLIRIHIPQASRKSRPVYINNNPMMGTYQRFNEGDHKCDDETIKRMLAEQVEDARDGQLLTGYDLSDLEMESVQAYRQQFKASRATHPWNDLDTIEFLRCIGAWKKDRSTGEEGLTLAGLLMFGKLHAIHDAVPHYMLDYQERPEAKKELRWIDRVTLDGSWSGNLFDFYRKVIRKLTSDLKVPFALQQGQRQDDSPVHVALREALINTLVHADYTGRLSILVVKRPDMFGFRNPGLMRIAIEQAIRGGESDCRNRSLHKMFVLAGLAERAGSGVPIIYSSWASQSWRQPLLHEKRQPEQTLMELKMLDLYPIEVIEGLRNELGSSFDGLSELERLILVSAAVERVINHTRIMELTDVHSHDLTQSLARLVKEKLLKSDGSGRGTVYYLPGADLPVPEDAFSFQPYDNNDNIGKPPELEQGSEVSSKAPEVSRPAPEVGELSPEDLERLRQISKAVAVKGKAPRGEMEATILMLCDNRYLSLQQMSQLLGRSAEFLRKEYLNPMVRQQRLEFAYPTKPNHPEQRYRALKQNEHD